MEYTVRAAGRYLPGPAGCPPGLHAAGSRRPAVRQGDAARNVGLVVMPDGFMAVHRAPIILAAARNSIPVG